MEAETHIDIARPIDEVAARLLAFTAPDRWHPGLEGLRVEGQGVGAIRSYRLGGAQFRERLDAVDDDGLGCVYTVLETPLATTHFMARYRLLEVSLKESGEAPRRGTRVNWIAEIGVPAYVPPVAELARGMALAATALTDASLLLLKTSLEQGVELV